MIGMVNKDKLKRKLEKESEELYDVHEDSDIPITEKKTKEKKFKKFLKE